MSNPTKRDWSKASTDLLAPDLRVASSSPSEGGSPDPTSPDEGEEEQIQKKLDRRARQGSAPHGKPSTESRLHLLHP
jgi:hypothetical protein